MTLHVLGCAGSLTARGHTTTLRLDDDVLIDAGSGIAHLGLDDLARIDHILLTHSHIDHLLGVPLLADAVQRVRQATGRPPVCVHGLPETLDALARHVLNNVIWPDFTRLPAAHAPALTLQPLHVGEVLALGRHERRIAVLPAAHSVPAVGYGVLPGAGSAGLAFSGDTGPCPALWTALRATPVRTLILEVAFAPADAELARLSGHHSPQSLAAELAAEQATHGRLPFEVLRLTHAKPGDETAIADGVHAALAAVGLHTLAVAPLVEGERLALAP